MELQIWQRVYLTLVQVQANAIYALFDSTCSIGSNTAGVTYVDFLMIFYNYITFLPEDYVEFYAVTSVHQRGSCSMEITSDHVMVVIIGVYISCIKRKHLQVLAILKTMKIQKSLEPYPIFNRQGLTILMNLIIVLIARSNLV